VLSQLWSRSALKAITIATPIPYLSSLITSNLLFVLFWLSVKVGKILQKAAKAEKVGKAEANKNY
jgi:hypothetical protein